MQESKLVFFRQSKSYPRDIIQSVEVKPGAGVVFAGPRYDVVLVLRDGKVVRLKSFRSEQEASNFRSEVLALINK